MAASFTRVLVVKNKVAVQRSRSNKTMSPMQQGLKDSVFCSEEFRSRENRVFESCIMRLGLRFFKLPTLGK